jgi:type I restriction enzyme S subunit
MKRGLVHCLLAQGIGADGRIRAPEVAAFSHTRFGIFPASWEILALHQVAEVGSGVTLGRDLSGSRTVSLPYLRVANVQDGHIDTTEMKTVAVREEEVGQFLLHRGDVLMTEGGDIDKLGRGAIWDGSISPCLHQNHIFRVRADRSRLNPHYLAAVIAAEYGKRYFMRIAKRTTNLASINKTQLRAFPIPLPPFDEQERIIEVVAAAERRIRLLEGRLSLLQQLKRGLQQELLTGRVRVTVA